MNIGKFSEHLKNACVKTDQSLEKSLYYSEYNYQNVLLHFLAYEFPHQVISKEVSIPFKLDDGFTFGYGRADIIIESEEFIFILELKAHVDMRFCRKYCGQILKYAQHLQSEKTFSTT